MRAEGERLAPGAHGAGGIEALGLAERANGLGVVEGEGEDEALVEVPLGQRIVGVGRAGVGAHTVEERREPVGLGLGGCAAQEQHHQEQKEGRNETRHDRMLGSVGRRRVR